MNTPNVPEFLTFVQARRAVAQAELDACDAALDALAMSQPQPNPVPEPEPPVVVDPGPVDPAPVPAQPSPPPSSAPAGSRTAGRDVAGCKLPGVSVTASAVTITSALATFDGWNIGQRRLVFIGRVGKVFDITSIDGASGSLPLIQCMPGGGFDEAEHITTLGSASSMVFKQERGGFASVMRRWDARGMAQDAFKVAGGNVIERNRIADAIYRGGAPHADALTAMQAEGSIIFRDNDVDWNYAGKPDQGGINNWFRIESYAAGSNSWDDIIIEGNRLKHANANSFAMQVAMKGSPTWRGSIKVRNNVMEKAGGSKKILYAPSQFISEWTGNTDGSGADIPLAAA